MSSNDDRNHPRIIIEEYESRDLDADENLAGRFYGSICEEIDQNNIEQGGRTYQQLLSDGPTFNQEVLESISRSMEESDCVRLTALFKFLSFDTITQYVYNCGIELEEVFDGFDEQPLYHYCVFSAYRELDLSYGEEAFVSGAEAAEHIRTDPDLYYKVASLGMKLVQQTEFSHNDYYGEQIDKKSILSKSAKVANEAISGNHEIPEYYLTHASILEFQEKFKEALNVLREGRDMCVGEMIVSTPNGRDAFVDDVIPEFDEQIERVQNNQRRYRLQESIESADNRIDGINSDLSHVERELENAVEQYRTQILQFIGFFAAIVTIVLASVNIATTLTFPQSGGLILVLVGAIVLAFGELNFLFGHTTSESNQSRNWGTIVGGVLLIIAGMASGIYL